MTTYGAQIVDAAGNDPAHGDNVTVTRTVTGVPASDTLATAWLTLKAGKHQLDVDAVLQLEITSSQTASGQITDTGADQTGSVTFVIAGANYNNIVADNTYYYDIAVLTTAGVPSTLEIGTVTFVRDVTRATS